MTDSFLSDIDRLERLAEEIFVDVNEKSRLAKRQENTARISSAIRRKINQLTAELNTLDSDLAQTTRISEKERTRRQDLLVKLANKRDQLNSMSKDDYDASRDALLSGARSWGQESEHTRDLDNKGLNDYTTNLMKVQDDHLDKLSKTISRTTELAKGVGVETEEHIKIITDIEGKVDHAHDSIHNTTQNVSTFASKHSLTMLWCIILILVVTIIIVLLV